VALVSWISELQTYFSPFVMQNNIFTRCVHVHQYLWGARVCLTRRDCWFNFMVLSSSCYL